MSGLSEAMASRTPLQRLGSLDGLNDFWVKRDDLLPFCFGGNKARIAAEFVADARSKGSTCMVGYGGMRSNLSRALACACSLENMRCVVIVPTEDNGLRSESYNSRMLTLLGAELAFCSKSEVRSAVRRKLDELLAVNCTPELGLRNKSSSFGGAVSLWEHMASRCARRLRR